MIKKLLCFAVICLVSVQVIHAQKLGDVKLGLKFAPDISFMSPGTKDYNSNGVKLGGVLGLVTDVYFAEHYAFSTGFNMMLLGGKLSFPDSLAGKVKGTTNSSMNFFYFEIPVMVKMFTKKFGKFSFFGQIGFGTDFRISASAKNDFTGNNGYTESEKSSITYQTTTIRESILIGLGSEVYLDQSTRIFFGLGYSNSLNNVLKGYNEVSTLNQKAYLNYAELNLGVMF
ncbi:MAG: porin family protein [Bacteroidetes bacterium]|nr:porin family protein [Bacteroidota bacterium]